MSQFQKITLQGNDAAKFLQGQLTINTSKLSTQLLPCAISDLKGRIAFGLWVNQTDDVFTLITASDCMEALSLHIKKYGVFSKFTQSTPAPVYPCVENGLPTFTDDQSKAEFEAWATASIQTGNYWITQKTQGLFQPQELRLHQRGGVDYDKGCYLGQEVIARLWFKASPKAYLHRVLMDKQVADGAKIDKVQVVNSAPRGDGFDALVVGSPEQIAKVGTVLALPDELMGDVARVK
ncbi:MAG: folate-binding Fe/S cluster repair protein [Moraxella sp.]|nr:folate-binding Fe/S cluster repair protein [Moraxella sp.]